MRIVIQLKRCRDCKGNPLSLELAHVRALVRLKDNHTQEFKELLAIEEQRHPPGTAPATPGFGRIHL